MRRRLILSTGLIALAAVLILGVPLGIVEGHRARAEAVGRLEREADRVSAVIDDRVEAGKPITRALLALHVRAGHMVVVVTPDGRRTVAGHVTGGARLTEPAGAAQRARVTVSAPRAEVDDRVRDVWLLIAALAVGGTLAATALAALQARRLVRPLDALAGTSRRLGQGDFTARAGRLGVPELDVVAAALDRSTEQLAKMVAREREFSANVSHQLRTPLTALRLRLEEVAALDDPEARGVELELALGEADRLNATIHALLEHARAREEGRPVELNLDRVVEEQTERWATVYREAARPLMSSSAGRATGTQLGRGRRAGPRRAPREHTAFAGAGSVRRQRRRRR